MSQALAVIVRRCPVRLTADPARVITRLWVPGLEAFDREDSRVSAVLERLLALDEDDVERSVTDVVARFERRHRHLEGTFQRHAEALAHRLDPRHLLSESRRLLLGATFTSEYAIEGAALCNPSVVAHPDQTGVAAGSVGFVMSVRGIGEGHISSIGFRTGTVDAAGEVTVGPSPTLATTGRYEDAPFDSAVFRGALQQLRRDGESADYVLDALADRFSRAELEEQLEQLHRQMATRSDAEPTIELLRRIAERTYGVSFASGTSLAERVLWPAAAFEGRGLEDARFVRFVADDGAVTYYATYTAYDGADICEQLLETVDFRTFTSSPIVGAAAANKGLAIFPRRVGGRFVALSRADRETNAVAFSDDVRRWDDAVVCQVPARPWELLQLGNCGSPIETDAGWLVLTHGVGPMRTYSIGALLLDLDDPTRVIGRLREPLISPAPDEQDGYVPNVVYSCGALLHAGTVVVPYGIGDAAIGIATVALTELLGALEPPRN
jgi:predicted GH43/DUF377 family glycosyl hydrolase